MMRDETFPGDLPRLVLEGTLRLVDVPNPAPIAFRGFVVATDGRYWISDDSNHRLLLVDESGQCQKVIGERGSGLGQFWYPAGLAQVGEEIWVADSWNHRVQRFDLDGVAVGMFGAIGSSEDQFDEPVAIAPLRDGRVAILDRGNCRIRVVDSTGSPLVVWGERGTWDPERKDPYVSIMSEGVRGLMGERPLTLFPMSLCVWKNGLCVADTNNHRLLAIDDEGGVTDVHPFPGNVYPTNLVALDESVLLLTGVNHPPALYDVSLRSGGVALQEEEGVATFRDSVAIDHGSLLHLSPGPGTLRRYRISREAGGGRRRARSDGGGG